MDETSIYSKNITVSFEILTRLKYGNEHEEFDDEREWQIARFVPVRVNKLRHDLRSEELMLCKFNRDKVFDI